jgi:hypothetical protein
MTTETNHACPQCGTALGLPAPVARPPEPAGTAFMIEYHAACGVCCHPIITMTAAQALEIARSNVAQGLDIGDFDFADNSAQVTEIIVVDQDAIQRAIWTDPACLIEKHSTEILDLLEALIEAVDGMTEARANLDQEIGEIEGVAFNAARELKRLGVQGGAQ